MRIQRSPAEFGFDHYDKARLEKALHGVADKRTFLRLNAVLLFAEGMNIHTVAKITGKSVRVIYPWIDLYLESHNPASLYDSCRTGRPFAAKQITGERILRELKRNPLRLGYNATVWSVALLAKHLNALLWV